MVMLGGFEQNSLTPCWPVLPLGEAAAVSVGRVRGACAPGVPESPFSVGTGVGPDAVPLGPQPASPTSNTSNTSSASDSASAAKPRRPLFLIPIVPILPMRPLLTPNLPA